MPTHDGHRDRMRERFQTEGLDSFTDIQALELLLYYCIPRKDTNPIAHNLLERFGGFSQVLDAPVAELAKVEGMGERSASFLSLIAAAGRYYGVDKNRQIKVLPTLESCAEYLLPYFVGRTTEMVYLLCMDAKCKVLSCKCVSEGNVNTAGISVRKVVEQALASNATTVIMAHNHPGGLAMPSGEDIQTTRQIAAALMAVEIHLADHIIVADEDYVSMTQSGYRLI